MNLKLFILREKLSQYQPILNLFILMVFIFLALSKRVVYFQEVSKDVYAYDRAIGDLISGVNPYKWTVESFSNPNDPSNHGFAYFPGMLYLFTPGYILHLQTGLDHYVLWKMPVLLADIGVGILLYIFLKKRGMLPLILSLFIWFFNPYNFFRSGYSYTDPITIFFMFLSIILLQKDDVASGAFYALSVGMKTFPFILFPVMLLCAKNKKGFLLAGMLVGLLLSLPFLKNLDDFMTYLNGTLLVHQTRFVQGRPFLYYISYFYHVEFFRMVPFGIYTLLASLSGTLIGFLLYYFRKLRDKYILSLIPFLGFYLFTPVFNRTYFLWFIPIFLMATSKMFEYKHRWLFYVSQIAFFIFAGWYLLQWHDGFHVWHP